MAELYLLLLTISVVLVLARAIIKPALIFEYPYFIAATFAVFILPQAFSLLRFPGYVSQSAVADVMLMSLLCMLASVAGYKISPSVAIFKRVASSVNPSKLFHVGVVFTLISFIFAYLLSRTEVTINDRGGMTGVGTIYLFFVGLSFPGFAICLRVLLLGFSIPRLLCTLLAGLIPLVNVLSVRREPTIVLALSVALALFYSRRVVPPRILICAGLVFAALAIPATGVYRSMLKDGVLAQKFTRFNLIDNFKNYFGNESILELRNAAALIESTQRFDGYLYGAGYWNQIVFRYVPAQIIGAERKNALMFGTSLESMQQSVDSAGHEYSVGSTLTGMGDSFQNLGWFGCLFFAFLAVFFRSVWLASLWPNALFAQLLYMLVCTSAMRSVTHQTTDFLPGLIYQVVFLSLGVFYAKDRSGTIGRRRNQHSIAGGRPPFRSGSPQAK